MAKHVTIFKMQVKPGMVDQLTKVMNDDGTNMDRIKAAGWKSTIVGSSKDNPNEVWGTVTWDNSENYRKNAEDPAQNASFQQMRALLDADPEWHDCDVIEEQRA